MAIWLRCAWMVVYGVYRGVRDEIRSRNVDSKQEPEVLDNSGTL
jgi:hypothetical protein